MDAKLKGVKSAGLCAIDNLRTAFSRFPCMARLDVAKRGTCTRFRRQKQTSGHYFWKIAMLRYCDSQTCRGLVDPSWSLFSSALCPACLANCWPSWPTLAAGWPPDAWLWTHTGGSYIDLSMTSSFVALIWRLEEFGFLDFPASAKFSTHAK